MSMRQKREMSDSREERRRVYKPRITTSIIIGYAVFIMIIGALLFLAGLYEIIDKSNIIIAGIAGINLIITGLGAVIVGSLIYIIGALSKDVYEIVSFLDYSTEREGSYYQSVAKHLQRLERDQEAIKSGIAVISSKLGTASEKTETRRYSREINMGE